MTKIAAWRSSDTTRRHYRHALTKSQAHGLSGCVLKMHQPAAAEVVGPSICGEIQTTSLQNQHQTLNETQEAVLQRANSKQTSGLNAVVIDLSKRGQARIGTWKEHRLQSWHWLVTNWLEPINAPLPVFASIASTSLAPLEAATVVLTAVFGLSCRLSCLEWAWSSII